MIRNSAQLAQALRSIVRYHRSCGVKGYVCSEHVETAFKLFTAGLGVHRQEIAAERRTQRPAVSPGRTPPMSSASALDQLREEIVACRMCPLYHQRVRAVTGDGGYHPQLLIVGEWPILQTGLADRQVTVFGAEEDLMLERIRAALGLSPDQVYVTSVVKCGVHATVRPSPEQAKTCSGYLRRQVDALEPAIICAMGPHASQILTGIERPLSMLRGRVFPCRLADKSEIPVVPTYHPTFLLHNPDMKQAAWQDLQLIMKRLSLPRRKTDTPEEG